ncbi:MAG: glucosaminidase domain-containing protein [Candidatus Tenebribacter davisii]|jgi:Bax protein|nr:glucosaminidase domain-containing protein [Candidatus Tenebribacter davisii]
MPQNKLFSLAVIFMIIVFAISNIVSAMQIKDNSVLQIDQFTSVPSFTGTSTYDERTQSFFDFLSPIVKAENSYIMRDRIRLLKLIKKFANNKLNEDDINWIDKKAQYYKLSHFSHNDPEDLANLLTRIDIIPELLVMSQAAIESAHGTSNFAKRANNLFGMRTLSPNRGIIPKRRPKNRHFYVAKYDTVNQSIQSYLRNLNTHGAYKDLRDMRQEFRQTEKPLDAYKLVNGLKKYSTEGDIYIQKIRRTMKKNESRIIQNI